MKIQCDFCNKDEASVFCVSDEAALCVACDHRVHHANKLAGKHQRFTLLQPPPKQVPLCDICQERRGFLFCQQDRAILCRECDIPIHKANELTQKHDRFLLPGVKVSATSALYSWSSESCAVNSSNNNFDTVPAVKSNNNSVNKPVSSTPPTNPLPSPVVSNTATPAAAPASTGEIKGRGNNQLNGGCNSSLTSSISEYLIEMLPGWHVEDLLDSASPYGLCKNGNNELMPFWDADIESNKSSFSPESMGFWVPQVPPPLHPNQPQSYPYNSDISFDGHIGINESKDVTNIKYSTRKWSDDNSFAVPQISPHTIAPKRPRTLW